MSCLTRRQALRPPYRHRRSAAARPCSRHKHQFREMKAIPSASRGSAEAQIVRSLFHCHNQAVNVDTLWVQKSPSSKYPPLMTLSALILLRYKEACKTSLRSEIIFKHNLAEGRLRNPSLARLKRSLLPINFTHKNPNRTSSPRRKMTLRGKGLRGGEQIKCGRTLHSAVRM